MNRAEPGPAAALPADSLELLTRALCDVRAPLKTEGAFLFGQTADNQASVLEAARTLLEENLAEKVLFLRSAAGNGYPGFAAWRTELLRMGVPEEKICGIDPPATAALNTLTEAQALLAHARRNGLRALYVVAAPFHQLRAFMTAITVALKHYPDLRLHSFPGAALPWLESAVHSQGITSGPRKDLIGEELIRIRKYQAKGDLAAEGEILEYLNRRDCF